MIRDVHPGSACRLSACSLSACLPAVCLPVACLPIACLPVACLPVACHPVACVLVAMTEHFWVFMCQFSLEGGGGNLPTEIDRKRENYVSSEPVFVDLLRSPGINSQPGGIDSSAP